MRRRSQRCLLSTGKNHSQLECTIQISRTILKLVLVSDIQSYSINHILGCNITWNHCHSAKWPLLSQIHRLLCTHFQSAILLTQAINLGQWNIKEVQQTPEGESQKVKLKVRVNLHGIITVASASLVEKKQDGPQVENVEMENSNENQVPQETSMETNGASQEQQNGPENQEVRDDDGKGEPQQRQSWTQRVGQWLIGVRVPSASVQPSSDVCCQTCKIQNTFALSQQFQIEYCKGNKHHIFASSPSSQRGPICTASQKASIAALKIFSCVLCLSLCPRMIITLGLKYFTATFFMFVFWVLFNTN